MADRSRSRSPDTSGKLEPVTLALDWTPNTNHTGFYIAKAKGFYAQAGLDVSFISPHVDEYKVTPASRVEDGSAHFAICPSESVISYHTHPEAAKPKGTSQVVDGSAICPSETVISYHTQPEASKLKVRGVAAILSGSTSAVVTLESSGIDRPSKLDGKTYASYGARYEGRIVQQMIVNDGGKGEYKESTPAMLGIWNTLLKGEADATWVFMGWEGIEAELKGVKLNTFKLEDFKPSRHNEPHHSNFFHDSSKPEMIKKFLAATSKGFELAASNAAEAAKIFLEAVSNEHSAAPLPEPLDKKMVIVIKLQMIIASHESSINKPQLLQQAQAVSDEHSAAPLPEPLDENLVLVFKLKMLIASHESSINKPHLLQQAVSNEHSTAPLPEPLDQKMVIASHEYTAKYFLNEKGQWGYQDEKVWDEFLDWLSSSGLLTSKVQSRGTASEAFTSLDGLRQGDVGQTIPRDQIKASALFTNEFLHSRVDSTINHASRSEDPIPWSSTLANVMIDPRPAGNGGPRRFGLRFSKFCISMAVACAVCFICGAGVGFWLLSKPSLLSQPIQLSSAEYMFKVQASVKKSLETFAALKKEGHCSNSCATARNGFCEDGSRASESPSSVPLLCDLGTDCADCGPWKGGLPIAIGKHIGPVAYSAFHGIPMFARKTETRPSFIAAHAHPEVDLDVSNHLGRDGMIESDIYISDGNCIRPDGSRALVLDVGANFGYFSLYAAKMGCRVIAWEPVPRFQAFIKYALQANNLTHLVELREFVAGESEEDVEMSVPKSGNWGTASVGGINQYDPNESEMVKTSSERVDKVVKENVLLMKVDVEG
eukprot:gene16730-22999_t